MSPGLAILAGIAVVFAGLIAVQGWMKMRLAAQQGQPAPALPGPLGQLVRGDALLFFHSPTCGPCKVMAPHVDRLAATDARVQSIDVSQQLDVARAFAVMATPTVVAVHDGVIIDTRVGMVPPGALRGLLPPIERATS